MTLTARFLGMLWLIVWALATPAAAAASPSFHVPAAEAPVRTAGMPIPDENGAAVGWNLHSEGAVAFHVRVARSGTHLLRVRAAGRPLGGEWPRMAVWLDGFTGREVTVPSREPRDYDLPLQLEAGVHEVGVFFVNDALSDTEDRNLWLWSLDLQTPGGAGEGPKKTNREDWIMHEKETERHLLESADRRILEYRRSPATVAVLDDHARPIAGATVTVRQTRHAFLFGSNIFRLMRLDNDAENRVYEERFLDLLNYGTTGFYWAAYERERGRPDYAYTDRIVAWAREHGVRLKGHPILWDKDSGQPPWAGGQPSASLQQARIEALLRRYGDDIAFWEVVNEPSHCPGVPLGPTYRWARAARPDAHLIVNDYDVFGPGREPFLKLLQDSIANSVPFDGVGLQAHDPEDYAHPIQVVQANLDAYAALGRAVHITEFTPGSSAEPVEGAVWRGEAWTEDVQAGYARDFYRVCFAHPAVAAITWWDFSDRGSWRKGGGLLRDDLSPKPAYESLRRLIREEWWTENEGQTEPDGRFEFRGFHGDYEITVDVPGAARVTRSVTITAGEPNFSLFAVAPVAENPGR